MITSDIRNMPTNVFYREVDLVLKKATPSHTLKVVAGPCKSKELLTKALHKVEAEVKEMLPDRTIVLGDIIEVKRHKVRQRSRKPHDRRELTKKK
jgi:hypothetical protein